jgi:FkbM family methyltransferase
MFQWLQQRFFEARHALFFNPASLRLLDGIIRGPLRSRIRSRGVTVDVSSDLVDPWVRSAIFWGVYEKPEVMFVDKYLRPDCDVIELGGSLGVVTSHIARRIAVGQRAVSIEADPRLVPIIRQNVGLNAPDASTTVIHGAIYYAADRPVSVRFSFGQMNLTGGVAGNSNKIGVDVPARRLSEIHSEYGLGRYTLVSDIEGAEAGLIASNDPALAQCVMAILELHETQLDGRRMTIQAQVAAWQERGFELFDHYRDVYAFRRPQSAH